MLERAKGCLEHGGRQLLRLPQDTVTRTRLNSTFWTHGAGDIDLPTCWLSILSPQCERAAAQQAAINAPGSRLTAGVVNDGILDFLYPPQSLDLLRKFSARDSGRRRRSAERARSFSGTRLLARKPRQRQKPKKEEIKAVDYGQYLGQLLRERRGERTGSVSANSGLPREKVEGRPFLDRALNPDPTRAPDRGRAPAFKTDFAVSQENGFFELTRARDESSLLFSEFASLLQNPKEANLDLDSQSQVEEVVGVGQLLHEKGREAIRKHQVVIRSLLMENREIHDWTESEWTIAMGSWFGSPDHDTELQKLIWEGLGAGSAKKFMLPLLEQLLLPSWKRIDRRLTLRDTYEEWRRALPPQHPMASKSFWDYIVESKNTTFYLATRALRLIDKDRQALGSNSMERRTSEYFELLRAILSREDFGLIDQEVAADFYKRLADVLHSVPEYSTLHGLLQRLLFIESSTLRKLDGQIAFRVFSNMARFGGYKGEVGSAPDLGRKLFWRLSKLQELDGAREVFRNLQWRRKANATETSYLLFKLSQQGRRREFEDLLSSLRNESYQKGGRSRRTGADLYEDRLRLHLQRNDLDAVRTTIQELLADHKVTPRAAHYNMAIAAHARIGDLEGAEEWFARLSETEVKPDLHSYIPFMSECAKRGDIETVRALTHRAESQGILLDDSVVNCHVRALINAGALEQAGALVSQSHRFHMNHRQTMFEELIGAYALKGERTQVSSLLAKMRRMGVKTSLKAYAHHMRMWCVKLRPDKAGIMLTRLLARSSERPLVFHFTILMKGWLDKNMPQKVFDVFDRLESTEIEPDWTVKRILALALERLERGKDSIDDYRLQRYQEVAQSLSEADFTAGGPFEPGGVERFDESFATTYFQFLVSVAPGDTEMQRVEYAWESYSKYMESQSSDVVESLPPLAILSKLLDTYRQSAAWGRVDQCWTLIRDKAADTLRKSPSGRTYILSEPLRMYLKALASQNRLDTDGKLLIASLLEEGFMVDHRCWNTYVRLLLLVGPQFHRDAFQIAEETIMFGWQGWPDMGNNKQSQDSLRSKLLYYARTRSLKKENRSDAARGYKKISLVLRPRPDGSPSSSPSDTLTAFDQGLPSSSDTYAVSDRVLGSDSGSQAAQPALDQGDVNVAPNTKRAETGMGDGMKTLDIDNADLQSTHVSGERGSSSAESEPLRGRNHDGPKPGSTVEYPAEPPAQLQDPEDLMTVLYNRPTEPGDRLLRTRPEYSTLVLLTRAFLDMRVGATFDADTNRSIRELSQVAPRVVQAILTMPRVDDKLQTSVLRRQ